MAERIDDRRLEQDIKYFRKVLGRVDEGISLPYSLTSEVLLSKLDSVQLSAEPQVTASALSFLRSKVFSLQSVLSYAIAFVLIVAVAYGMRSGGGDIIDGNIVLQSAQTLANASPDEQARAVGNEEGTTKDADDAAYAPNVISDSAVSSRQNNLIPPQSSTVPASDSANLGIGGGGETVKLGEDEKYIYMCRQNDQTDPDKAQFPFTIELIGASTNETMGFIDVPDIANITEFYISEGFTGIVGSVETGIALKIYGIDALESEGEAVELFSLILPGEYIGSHFVDGVLRVVTLDDTGGAFGDIEEIQLPDAATGGAKCLITAVDAATGEFIQKIFAGVDKDVSIHDHNIYMSYSTDPDEDGKTELFMVQIPLEGLDLEMVLVP